MANFYGSYIGFGAGGTAEPWTYQGTLYGYLLGGNTGPAVDHIQKWPFATDSDATDVANLTVARDYGCAGLTSASYGYMAGGTSTNNIERWIFSSDADATETGDLTVTGGGSTGASSETTGYVFKGSPASRGNIVEKFSVADGTQNASKLGDLVAVTSTGYGHSSVTKGYTAGGYNYAPSPAGFTTVIQAVTFADESIDTSVGDIMVGGNGRESASSVTHGYCAGGENRTDRIDNYSFADESVKADVGDLDGSSAYGTGGAGNSLLNAYFASGHVTDAIDKLNFASGGNAVAVAGVDVPVNEAGGTHV